MLKVVQPVRQKMVLTSKTGNRALHKASLGFTFIGLMIIMAISGIVLAAVGVVWKQDAMRTKEAILIDYGLAYQKAITSYYENNPSGLQQLPNKLEDLLLDKRYPNVKRHIRRLYENPITPKAGWKLIREQGRIKGVSTDSDLAPIKKKGFPKGLEAFEKADSYADWQFVFQDPNANAQGQSSNQANPTNSINPTNNSSNPFQ